MEEKQRYLKIQQEDETVYVAYFTINSIVGELDFPSSEIFYYQQQQFTFPIDTSMNVEIVANRKALSTVRNKKKELKTWITTLGKVIMKPAPMWRKLWKV